MENSNKDLTISESSLVSSRNELISNLFSVQYHPAIFEEKHETEKSLTIPITQIGAVGTAFKPLATAFQNVFAGGAGGSGLYWVDVPKGFHLSHFSNKPGYLGSSLSNINNQGFRQATLNPLAFDPTMLFMAAVLMSIDKKLDAIKEGQQEILEFLQQKEKAKQRGNLNFLNDILNNYKYNFENATYKTNLHIKVLDIKQEAEQSILFYREQIDKKLNNRSLLHSDKNVRDKLIAIRGELVEYQLALYLYAFSSFLEVLLLENYQSAFLDDIKNKIKSCEQSYSELYHICYDMVEAYSQTSVQSHMLGALAVASKAVGTAVNKIPVISKSQLDENLIASSDKLTDYKAKRTEITLERLEGKENSSVEPFIENIIMIDQLYNQPLQMLFDQENIYITCGKVEE